MKRTLLFLAAALLFATSAIASPLQVATIVLVYNCPDGYEYVIHSPGDSYLHTCADKTEMNNASTTIDHRPQYTAADLSDADALAIFKNETPSDEAQEKINNAAIEYAQKFITDRDNAPAPVEPTVADYQQMIESKMQEVEQMTEAVKTVATKAQLESIKASIDAKSVSVATSISEKSVIAEEIKK